VRHREIPGFVTQTPANWSDCSKKRDSQQCFAQCFVRGNIFGASSTSISEEIFPRPRCSLMLHLWGLMRPMMPILFWLPLIYVTALFEIAADPTKKAPKPNWFEQPMASSPTQNKTVR
jgi:hypothetical protein